MIDQEFSTKSGVKVRTIEAEASGGLIEVDLRKIKPTTEGTYLIASKDLQAVGKWAFTLDVAQAKKEGKEVPPEVEKDIDKTTMFLNDLMQKLPSFAKIISDVKNARVHPIERGIEKALMEITAELTNEVLEASPEIREGIKDTIQDYLEKNFNPEEGN